MSLAALSEKLRSLQSLVHRIIGAPDYEAYLSHVRQCHPEGAVMTRDEFVAARLADRYSRPGSRCC